MNFYQGGGGRPQHISDSPLPERGAGEEHLSPPSPVGGRPPLAPLRQAWDTLLPRLLGEMETEDLILLLILYLLYRESGDSELLMIMGGLFVL